MLNHQSLHPPCPSSATSAVFSAHACLSFCGKELVHTFAGSSESATWRSPATPRVIEGAPNCFRTNLGHLIKSLVSIQPFKNYRNQNRTKHFRRIILDHSAKFYSYLLSSQRWGFGCCTFRMTSREFEFPVLCIPPKV